MEPAKPALIGLCSRVLICSLGLVFELSEFEGQ